MTLPTYSIVPLLRLPYAFISSLVKSLFLKNNYWLQYHEMSGTEQAGMELRAQFFHRIRPSSRSSAIKERASTASQYSRAHYSVLRGKKMIRRSVLNREPQLLTAMVVQYIFILTVSYYH